MCGAGAGNNKSSGGNGNNNKPAGPKKVVKPVNKVDYQARAKANKSTNIPILSTVIKDKYRNDDVSYNQAYWASQRASNVSQADMKAEQDRIGTGQAANLRNMLASKTKKKRLGLRQLKNSSVGVSGGSGYNGLNIIS